MFIKRAIVISFTIIILGIFASADEVKTQLNQKELPPSTSTQMTYSSHQELKDILKSFFSEIETIEISTSNIDEIKEILNESKEKINLLLNHNRECEDPLKALLKIRKSLLDYFLKTNTYPKNLEELLPHFLASIPQINVHNKCDARIKYVNDFKGKNYERIIDNTTEYIYFSDNQSPYYGFLLINSDKEYNGSKMYKY